MRPNNYPSRDPARNRWDKERKLDAAIADLTKSIADLRAKLAAAGVATDAKD